MREYANVLTRFGALVIDGLLILPFYIPIFVMNAMFVSGFEEGRMISYPDYQIILNLLIILAGVVFSIWNTIYRMGKTGQSLGRKFLNIAVLTEHGRPIGIGKAIIREVFGRWVSGIVCYVGYLNAFWDKKKQMWHDKMADCYVYYVEDNFS